MSSKNRENVTNMKETEKKKGTSNKSDDSKKKKKKWVIIVICFVLIAGVAEFGYPLLKMAIFLDYC